ncbi:unnamed protein product [Spirodela intermedia]|uniref:Uncharacterized protein n=1 Tax=Spirodela intermedia TaxID=51605 RepID=A0A7I8JIZ5_SPIIN|nr:unnamed protein product [Spirodela intermedia]CAA6669745.1 unnamed protein product [Spirodela intermedia]
MTWHLRSSATCREERERERERRERERERERGRDERCSVGRGERERGNFILRSVQQEEALHCIRYLSGGDDSSPDGSSSS